MSYATLADTQGLIAEFTIDISSAPTTTQATTIVTDTAAEIDARLAARGISTPVVGPSTFLRALALLNAYGAAAAILKSWFPDATGSGDNPPYMFWEKRYQDGLAALSNGSMIPPDVLDNSNFVLPATYLTENADAEYALGIIAEPLFKIGTKF